MELDGSCKISLNHGNGRGIKLSLKRKQARIERVKITKIEG
jgi:hypothetical protein